MSETTKPRQTNRQFADQPDSHFRNCCQRASEVMSAANGKKIIIEPTARQASKFRNGKGAAYHFGAKF